MQIERQIPYYAPDGSSLGFRTQTKMEPVPMTDPDGHPYINYASVPKYAGVGDYIIQTLMTAAIQPVLGAFPPAAVVVLQDEAKAKAAEVETAKQAALSQVLIPA